MKSELKIALESIRGCEILNSPIPFGTEYVCVCDETRICATPEVSVHMLAYQHEKYIDEAIAHCMEQLTHFDFELVIGEDCSSDNTRACCISWQKRFPERIRVLCNKSNMGVRNNYLSVLRACRGKYIAFCEGDDYWIDKYKLQRQVEIMRNYPEVGICGARNRIQFEERNLQVSKTDGVITEGVYLGSKVFASLCTRSVLPGVKFGMGFFQTSSIMVRNTVLKKALVEYQDLFSLHLCQLDHTMKMALISLSDAYFYNDEVSVYRKNQGGLTRLDNPKVEIDATVASVYMLSKVSKMTCGDAIKLLRDRIFICRMDMAKKLGKNEQRRLFRNLKSSNPLRKVFGGWRAFLPMQFLKFGLYRGAFARYLTTLYIRACGSKFV